MSYGPGRQAGGTSNLAVVAISLWALLLAGLGWYWWNSHRAMPQPVPSTAAAISAPPPAASDQAIATLVAAKTAELPIPKKTAVLPYDLALDTYVAIKRGDFAAAERIATEAFKHSRLQSWRFYPYSDYIRNIVAGESTGLLNNLNAWVQQAPGSASAYMIRAEYYRAVARISRGDAFPEMVPDALLKRADEYNGLARSDFRQALLLNPNNPQIYLELLAIETSSGSRDDAYKVFLEGTQHFPTYYPLYRHMLLYWSAPKWGGSVDGLYEFTERYAGKAAKNSPLKFLYLALYAALLEDANFECYSPGLREQPQCVSSRFDSLMRPEVRDGIGEALNLYKTSDPMQFNAILWAAMEGVVCGQCIGTPANYSGAVLQIAAGIMGSDNQLMDKPVHNSYVLDDLTAQVWAAQGNSENAERKYREALKDVMNTRFPDEAQRDVALAAIYLDLDAMADRARQPIDVIVYQNAAAALGGPNFASDPWEKCAAYFALKLYQDAVKECTAQIEGHGNYLNTHYWRARAYEALARWDEALADFEPVASSSNNYLRTDAAIEMTVVYGNKGDFRGQLDSQFEHAFMFNERFQSRNTLAVAYNNRCYAYMRLGQLEEALADCTKSLSFDQIPDAYNKQQALIRRLKAKGSK